MPGGSDYQGPAEALELYTELVEKSNTEATVKGAKNPYTSRNGHMFSFLGPDGGMALRLAEEAGEDFQSQYESGPVLSYGSVMRGYVSVPDDLLGNTDELQGWFEKSWEWIGTLEPKATKK